jgi:hypothetical protein
MKGERGDAKKGPRVYLRVFKPEKHRIIGVNPKG